jgi:ribosomal protein S18 acetylase RimI-like enzyme
MKQETKVIPADNSHLEDILNIFYEGFSEKLGFITRKTDQQLSFARDFNLFNIESTEQEFVGIIDDRVMGFLSLKFLGQSEGLHHKRLNMKELYGKYGFFTIIRAWLFDFIFHHKLQEGELYIDTVGVLTEARGKGVGTSLLRFCETFAKERGFEKLTLMVIYENPKALALYKRLKYTVVSNHSLWMLKKSTGVSGAYFMEKKI